MLTVVINLLMWDRHASWMGIALMSETRSFADESDLPTLSKKMRRCPRATRGWRFRISSQKNSSAWAFWQTFDFSAEHARKRCKTLSM